MAADLAADMISLPQHFDLLRRRTTRPDGDGVRDGDDEDSADEDDDDESVDEERDARE